MGVCIGTNSRSAPRSFLYIHYLHSFLIHRKSIKDPSFLWGLGQLQAQLHPRQTPRTYISLVSTYIRDYTRTYWRFTVPTNADHSTSSTPRAAGDSFPMRFWLCSPILLLFIAARKFRSVRCWHAGQCHALCERFSSFVFLCCVLY